MIVFGIISGILSIAGAALAGFGISPPFVKNFHLSPGSHCEQEIIFSRADPSGDARMEVTIADAPEIEKWLSIDKGWSFILPDGQKQTPMRVLVDVPKDARFGNYEGKIRVKILPVSGGGGTVSIVLGGEISVSLAVTPEEFYDFRVRLFAIPEAEQGKPVKVQISIENKGNVAAAPTRVHLDIYDEYQRLLISGDDTELKLVPAFETKDTFAEFPANLELGHYWGDVKIFKGEELVLSGKIYFEVIPSKSFWVKFNELKTTWKIIIGVAALGIILAVILAIFLLKKRKRTFINKMR